MPSGASGLPAPTGVKWGMVPEGVKRRWRPLEDEVHLPQEDRWKLVGWAGREPPSPHLGGLAPGLMGPSSGKVEPQLHRAPAHGDPTLCGVAQAHSPRTLPALCSPLQLLSSLHFNYSHPSPPLRPASSQFPPLLIPFLSNSPSQLSPSPLPAPRPPSPRSPLPCIMHAVEAPNRIRHLRPSSRRESLCK